MTVHRLSNFHLPTRKEDPQDADIPSHRLMVRAGMIRRLSRGLYTYLPLGHRVLRKVRRIVREEMDRHGGQEILMPILQPRELWERTGRWSVYGPEMMKLTDRHERDYGLGPTHEEVVTELVGDEVGSYREYPKLFYQIATKFRDEIRPRFGVMRSREFIMKDAYSFDLEEEDARESYRSMERAYRAIFDRIGFDYRQVEAATGAIGGSLSHEFMVPADTGEDALIQCTECDYAANQEQAEGKKNQVDQPESTEGSETVEEFDTPGVTTIEGLKEIDPEADPERQIKTMVFRVRGRPTALLVPGDDPLNEVKLDQLAEGEVEEMTPGEIEQTFGAPPGSLGAVRLDENTNVEVWADPSLKGRYNLFTGANEEGKHLRGVSVERDIEVDRWCSLRLVDEGDRCVECGGKLEVDRGIEVGHVFYLGTKYSEALEATIQHPDGEERPLIMGCYGIGISRIVAAVIEDSHDDRGIIWPESVAPFDVYLLPIPAEDSDQARGADRAAEALAQRGYEVLIDDRDAGVGARFADSELIGIPLRITFGRDYEDGLVEWTPRATGEDERVPEEDLVNRVEAWFDGE